MPPKPRPKGRPGGRPARAGAPGGRPERASAGAAPPAAATRWAVLGHVLREGFFLDKIVEGDAEEAELELAASRQGVQRASYFRVPVTAAPRSLQGRPGEKKPKFDLWLYRRDDCGNKEYELKLARRDPAAPDADPDPPPPPGEEWDAICICRAWMHFAL